MPLTRRSREQIEYAKYYSSTRRHAKGLLTKRRQIQNPTFCENSYNSFCSNKSSTSSSRNSLVAEAQNSVWLGFYTFLVKV